MEKIEDILKDLPEDLRIPFYKAFNVIKEESKELIAREEISKRLVAIKDITEAQKITERTLEDLIIGFSDLKKQVGGITNTIGYTLENETIKKMPN